MYVCIVRVLIYVVRFYMRESGRESVILCVCVCGGWTLFPTITQGTESEAWKKKKDSLCNMLQQKSVCNKLSDVKIKPRQPFVKRCVTCALRVKEETDIKKNKRAKESE